jgi:hypothetical protein
LLTFTLEKSWCPEDAFKQLSGKIKHCSLWLFWQLLVLLSLNRP